MFRNAFFSAATLALLAGCASNSQTKMTPSPAPASATPVLVGFELDQAYIDRVNAHARMRGISIVWVHPPLKRIYRHD